MAEELDSVRCKGKARTRRQGQSRIAQGTPATRLGSKTRARGEKARATANSDVRLCGAHVEQGRGEAIGA